MQETQQNGKTSNILGKKGSNFLVMKEDMLDSSSDDDDNVADDDDMNYKESDTEQNNSGAIEEAEQENDDDDDTEEEEESSDDEETKTDDDNNSFAFVQDVLCSMQDKLAIPKSWILLDSQSMVDMFSNPKLLDNIHDAKQVLTLHCNAGKAIVSKRGDLKGYGTVWYHPGVSPISYHSTMYKKSTK